MIFNNYDNNSKNDILGYRIKEARIARGYTLDELADSINVTKQSISKYENNLAKISAENMITISKLLNFPLTFFTKEKSIITSSAINDNPVFFRSLRKTSRRVKASLSQNLEFVEEFYSYFSKFIEFPKFNLDKNINLKYKLGASNNYIESVATKLREYWGLGDGPINDLTTILEKNGIIITRFKLDTHEVDAFSSITSSGTPIIVLGSDKKSAVRSRMDIAHELGHIVLHSNLSNEDLKLNHKVIEDEANKFAGAFLLPDNRFSKDIYTINIDTFVYLKTKWKVSIAAMIVRCYNLNLITNDQYTYLFKRISAKKWRTQEPLDDRIPFEKPKILREAIHLLIDNDILSINELVDNLAFSRKEIEKLCFLEDGYLGADENNIKPKLKIIK